MSPHRSRRAVSCRPARFCDDQPSRRSGPGSIRFRPEDDGEAAAMGELRIAVGVLVAALRDEAAGQAGRADREHSYPVKPILRRGKEKNHRKG